jgi:ABC-2 type transport system permease protein
MSTQSQPVHGSFDTQLPPATLSVTEPLYWSIRRELWEYRSIYVAPLAVAAVMVFGYLIASIGRALSTPDMADRLRVLEEPFTFATGLIMVTTFIVGIFYCLDALHGERRDRSILFWKSLPVSDFTTVFSKASIPFVVLPALTLGIVVAAHWIMLLLASLVAWGSGLSVANLWTSLSLPQLWIMLLYHTVTVHVFWYAPIYAWMILVSGLVRRAAFLWAALPAVAIAVIEKVAFNTTHFLSLMHYRFMGPQPFEFPRHGSSPGAAMMHLNLGQFLATPGLWSGLVIAGIFLAAAIQLRRYRGPL